MFLSLEEAQKIVSSTSAKSGCYNHFFKINDKIGLKICSSEKQRDYNYDSQTKAAEFELGPETYGKIDGIKFKGKDYYGYFTEIVWVISKPVLNSNEKYFLFNSVADDIENLISELWEKCEFEFDDYHIYNLGEKNGKLVCIDFDE